MQTFESAPEAEVCSVDRVDPGQRTIAGEIRRRAELQPDHPAVVATEFVPLSYRKLQNLIDEVRAALRLAGLNRSARIAIAMPNGPHTALAIVAVACSAVSVPLNPRQTLHEIEACLVALRPDAVLVIKGADFAARRAAERQGITIIEAIRSNNADLDFAISEPKAGTSTVPDASDNSNWDAPAFILQTSGTSQEPKLIPTSHRNMLAAAARVQAWFDLTPQDRCLCVSPVFYAHGLHVTVFAALLTGGTIAFPKDASKFDYAEWFGALKPTWYSAGPTLHRLVFDHIKTEADAKINHSLRFVLSGGAPLPRDLLEGLEMTLGVPVVEHYGSSEGMQICSNLLLPGSSKPGTVGIPWPDTIRIVSDVGRQLPVGEWGQILVGGPTVVAEYLSAPELNRLSFIDGWFLSGDLGSIDEDGFLTLHGRKDDLINRGGEKISPVEIEDALVRHPAVAEAAAFPVPHPRLGEDVAAAVVLHHGVVASPIEIRSFLQEQLALFKIPRRIILRGELPKGKTGKVLRRLLTASLAQEATTETQPAAPHSNENTTVDSALIVRLTEIWERLLKASPIYPNDDFFENGGDSLLAMEMLAELELLTGRTLSSAILLEGPTIAQLGRKLSDGDHLRTKSLFRLNPNGSQAPLFFFHGDFIQIGYSAVMLARLLGSDQPLLVVDPHGMNHDFIPGSIEAMAADRLPLILEAQPEGPYRLCGYCLGGVVAFEVARALEAAGKTVEMVVMIDPPTVSAGRSVQLLLSTMKRAQPISGPVIEQAMVWIWHRCRELQKFWNAPWTGRWALIRGKALTVAENVWERVHTALIAADQPGEPSRGELTFAESPLERRMRYAGIILSNYFPKPLAVPVLYFSVDYGGEAWRRISSDLEVIKSAGDHNNLDFVHIAGHLKARLQSTRVNTKKNAHAEAILDMPTGDDLIPKLTEICERLLKFAPITPDDDFFEKGGDSLLAMELHEELELLTGRTISSAILLEASTIGQLAQKLSEGSDLRRKSLIRLNLSGHQPPLFFFHGDFIGRGYSAVRLAGLLGPDQPLLVVDPHGMGTDLIPASIEAMAADRLPLILDAQPEGPYRLCGNCLGGFVAFEVARMLVAAGKKVELIVMLDSPTVSAGRLLNSILSVMRLTRPLAGPVVDQVMAWIWIRCADIQKFSTVSGTRRWAAIKAGVRRLLPGSDDEVAAPILMEQPGEASGGIRSVRESSRRTPDEIYTCYDELFSKTSFGASPLFFD